jgi:hypothetical protein
VVKSAISSGQSPIANRKSQMAKMEAEWQLRIQAYWREKVNARC